VAWGPKTLQRALDRARNEVMNSRFKPRTLALRYQLKRLLDDERLLQNPDEVVGMIDRDVALLDSELTKVIQKRADEVAARIADETGLELNPAAPEAPLALKAAQPDLRNRFTDEGLTADKLEALQHGFGVGWSAGGSVGVGIAYFFASTPIGWLAIAGGAALAAGAHMARKQLRQLRHKERDARRDEIEEQLAPYLDESIGQLEVRLNEALALTEEAIADAFDAMLSAEQARLEETQAATAAARARTEEEAAARAAELREPLAEIQALRATTDEMARAALAADRPTVRLVASVASDEGERPGGG
jgi:hypothetical protein